MAIHTQFSTDPNAIVTVQVSILEAPTPITYQQTGAFVSFGATTLTPGDAELLTQLSDLTPMLQSSGAITSAVWAGGTVTVTTTLPLPEGISGDTITMVLSGFTPAAYNGRFSVMVTGTHTFTYSVASNPGVTTVVGTFTLGNAIELQQMANTFFSQGNQVGVYVLELGYASTPANQALAMGNWLTNNPLTIYDLMPPRNWGSDPTYVTAILPLLQQYQAPTKMEYFWLTVTPSTTASFTTVYKNVYKMAEAPALTDPAGTNLNNPLGEFSLAGSLYDALVFRPSNTNRISPMAFKFQFGVTPYPTKNNGPLLRGFKESHTNYISTGAEGGISFTMVYEGVTADGHDFFNWWYTIDWVQIQVNLNLTNAIINGSNNPLAPLYYNQDGINYLETVLVGTMQDASSFGMVVGQIVMTQLDGPALSNAIQAGTFAGKCDVNAVPFLNYTLANPGDYKIGEYDGLSALFIAQRGFIHILVNIVVTDLVSV